jgi:hypothetical protein
VAQLPLTLQGMAFDGNTLWEAEQAGTTTEYLEPLLVKTDFNAPTAVIPEPSSLVLAALSLLGWAGWSWRSRRR